MQYNKYYYLVKPFQDLQLNLFGKNELYMEKNIKYN